MPDDKRTHALFKTKILAYAQDPSEHTINVHLDGYKHPVDVVSFKQKSTAMNQLVTNSVLKSLVQTSEKCSAKYTKTRRNGSRATIVKKSSGGFCKCFQINEKQKLDVEIEQMKQSKKDASKKKKVLQ